MTLLDEALQQVASGDATEEELSAALAGLVVHDIPLDRIVQRTGSGKLRSDLDGWILALGDLEPELAAALRALPMKFPETTTGEQALHFLMDVWQRQPGGVDSLRTHLAAAYAYVVDDLEYDDDLCEQWDSARASVALFGQGKWNAMGPRLVVADVRTARFKQLLPKGRVAVTAAHLGGESQELVRKVANALEIPLLSDDLEVFVGENLSAPAWEPRLRAVLDLMVKLEGRNLLKDITFHESLRVDISGNPHDVLAFVDDDCLFITGTPRRFAAEVSERLVDFFKLTQRGEVVPYLMQAIADLDRLADFWSAFKILAETLEVDTAGINVDEPPDSMDDRVDHRSDNVEDDRTGKGQPSDGGARSTAFQGRDIRHDGSREDVANGDVVLGESDDLPTDSRVDIEPATTRTGANWARIVDAYRGGGDGELACGGIRGDTRQRDVVLSYEALHGRIAERKPFGQRGHDIESFESLDPETGKIRRIEVKGITGSFEGEASVVLSTPQYRDAFELEAEAEYWLYVVDRIETKRPRVFPIPWKRSEISYGFHAAGWLSAAEAPAEIGDGQLFEINPAGGGDTPEADE